MDRFTLYYGQFQKLSPIARHVIFSVLFALLLRVGIAFWHHGYEDLSNRIAFIAGIGLVWSTGLWYAMKRLFVVFIWYLRIFH